MTYSRVLKIKWRYVIQSKVVRWYLARAETWPDASFRFAFKRKSEKAIYLPITRSIEESVRVQRTTHKYRSPIYPLDELPLTFLRTYSFSFFFPCYDTLLCFLETLFLLLLPPLLRRLMFKVKHCSLILNGVIVFRLYTQGLEPRSRLAKLRLPVE